MTEIYYIWMFSIVMAIWWWRIAIKWRAIAKDWRKMYDESMELTQQLREIAEDRQKDVDLLRKICNVWQIMAPMFISEALRTREDGIAYLVKLDQIMGFATDSEMTKGLDDGGQNNLAAAVVKMEKTREEVESFLDNFQD